MKFVKWFVRKNIFHLLMIALLYGVILSWGEDADSDRRIAIPFVTIVLGVLIGGKYKYWKKNIKNNNTIKLSNNDFDTIVNSEGTQPNESLKEATKRFKTKQN